MSEQSKIADWPAKLEALKARSEGDWLHPEVGVFLKSLRGRRLLVGCSGGADSVYLLCMLFAVKADFGFRLVVAHYNHRWRGEASDADEDFVLELAEALELPVAHAARPAKEAAFTETTARALRLNFLRDVAHKQKCTAIALGHQQDDILETQLIRLARGSGAEGLSAPRPVSRFEMWPPHIRPLLDRSAESIREDLRAADIPWREDSSNEDRTIARNALRHVVIPALGEAFSRDVHGGAARSRMLLEEDAAALDLFTREHFPEVFAFSERLDRNRLQAAPRAITRRALLAWFAHHGLIESFKAHALDLILSAIYEDKSTNRFSAGAHYLLLDTDCIRIEWAEADLSGLEGTRIQPGDSALLSTGAQISSAPVELSAAEIGQILSGQIDQAHEAYLSLQDWDSLVIRGWEPGDRFLPIGAPGMKKLKDWFIDRHIPRRERTQLPLVLSEAGEVLWVPGFPPAEAYKITPATKLALRLTYQSRNPL